MRRGWGIAIASALCGGACSNDTPPTSSDGGSTGPGATDTTAAASGVETTGDDVSGDGTGPDDRSPLCIALGDACHDDPVDAPTIGDPVLIAPSAALPSEVTSQVSHNNLDVAWHDDRLFFAFRTAPDHFAGPDTVMYVVSTADLQSWDFETSVALGTDVREPQLLSRDGELRLYFAVLGDDPLAFSPMGSRTMVRNGPGDWTDPAPVFDDDFLPWRIKDVDGTVYVTGYKGGAGVYDPNAPPIEVHWLTTTDGVVWTPAVAGQPVVLTGGSSETDFVFTDDGGLVAVSRNEAGDELGFGMKICRAPAGDLGTWDCVGDPRKYDSPLLFRHGPDVWLIGRRNVTDTGWYDLMDDTVPDADKYWTYQLDYWTKPKRCALWSVDPSSLVVELVLDLPSRGDTCFPELIPLSETQYLVFNYTSDLDGPDVSWRDGQLGPTSIYYAVLTMPPA